MASPRALLIEEAKNQLLPALESLGFRGIDPENEVYRPLDELGRAFPFGRFRRVNAEGNFDQLEIQFDNSGGCKFRICAGIVPSKGIEHPQGYISVSEAWAHYLPCWASLYQQRLFKRWFAPQANDKISRQQAVEAAAELLPEINHWLISGTRGRHMHVTNAY